MNVARVEFQNRMDGVKQYMAFRKVGGELEARVSRMNEFRIQVDYFFLGLLLKFICDIFEIWLEHVMVIDGFVMWFLANESEFEL